MAINDMICVQQFSSKLSSIGLDVQRLLRTQPLLKYAEYSPKYKSLNDSDLNI